VQLAGGEELRYDGLVVATGARPRPWPHPVPDGVFTLREVDDAIALREALLRGGRLVIVGAGFIGCEVAATARSLGVEVVLCDIAATPMAVLGPELGAACAALQLDHGVELVMGRSIEAFKADGDGRLTGVRLGDGSHVDAEVAVVALGAIPNIEWLQDSGLDVSRGLVCDVACAAVAHPEIAGAGDVAAWPHPLADGELVRVKHWSNAAEQGSVAGANLVRPAGERVPYDAVPSFWSDQYDVKVQSVGFAPRAERVRVLEGSIAERKFVAAGERDGRLIAAVGFNAARRMPFYRRLIGERAGFDDVVAAVAADERALPVAG
jgi:3-phenylpropionate/trans-cinnamate dioxygenase ferredoxin reductase component